MSPTVAVVGLGTIGLTAVKNLAEEGFDVTGFDANNHVGGLWQYSPEDKTSVMPTTIPNISTERGSYTDYPFPEGTPSFCTAGDIQRYLESYVDHFGFASRLRLNTAVKLIGRDEERKAWRIDFENAETQFFDKVVMATGMCQKPYVPKIESAGLFEGEMMHSSAFKRPENLKGKRVLVVGLGNTGADTCAALEPHASKIYLSYRRGTYILPRSINGTPGDHALTLRKTFMQGWLEQNAPFMEEYLLTTVIAALQRDAFTLRPEWRLNPAPRLLHAPPIISDTIVPALEAGTVHPVPGIASFPGGTSVTLTDGTTISVDAIVWCTGYTLDFSLLHPSADPTRATTPAWSSAPGSKNKPLPRLYRNIFSLDHPQSLAFLGPAFFLNSAMSMYDVAAMALAQIWKGNAPLPPLKEMKVAVDTHHAWLAGLAESGSVMPELIHEQEWLAWANDAAGTGVNEMLGWTRQGWTFWWRERRFCGMLMDGLFTPFVYRLFDGRRKRWEGAREAIERANRRVKDARR